MPHFDTSFPYLCKKNKRKESWQKTYSTGTFGWSTPFIRHTASHSRKAIEEIFDIIIVCDKRGGYKYYIENADDMEKGGIRTWLLNTFAVNNLINESHHLKRRILFEQIPSGQKYLTPLIEAMRDGKTVVLRYKSFWRQDEYSVEVEPFLVKVFRQRWYLLARNPRKDVLRIYALDRIRELRQTENTFTLPKNFSPEDYFYNSFGIISPDNCPPEVVKLKVYGTQKEYFRTLPLHHSQEEIENTDEYTVFRYYLSPTYDFIQEILSHGYNFFNLLLTRFYFFITPSINC